MHAAIKLLVIIRLLFIKKITRYSLSVAFKNTIVNLYAV